ncbi:DUF4468 domain-containing protein [Pedobacter polaris]|uniref:DUF4468 domain-containing protein n=1 Tax=Pedobacter polaris TaxID=2571273 RepID=A0A4U1CGD2_9SPHI|nr:DUF4468 domain-containing protein [Pedobacter polaris]TKC05698.1 DUF4468 domain-containing protein [Pedobacter polaris]
MKFILSFLLLSSCFVITNAQTEQSLPVDEQGKLIYYEVVNVKTPADSLKIRVLNYLKKQNKDLKFKSTQGDTAFIATGKMIINKTLLVMSHPSGEVLYDFQAEVKNGKYRFWLTNFSFIPYQRDRYANFVASTTVGIPLENNPGKLNAGEWKEYKVQTAKYAKDLASKFKFYMSSRTPIIALTTEKKVVKKEW